MKSNSSQSELLLEMLFIDNLYVDLIMCQFGTLISKQILYYRPLKSSLKVTKQCLFCLDYTCYPHPWRVKCEDIAIISVCLFVYIFYSD